MRIGPNDNKEASLKEDKITTLSQKQNDKGFFAGRHVEPNKSKDQRSHTETPSTTTPQTVNQASWMKRLGRGVTKYVFSHTNVGYYLIRALDVSGLMTNVLEKLNIKVSGNRSEAEIMHLFTTTLSDQLRYQKSEPISLKGCQFATEFDGVDFELSDLHIEKSKNQSVSDRSSLNANLKLKISRNGENRSINLQVKDLTMHPNQSIASLVLFIVDTVQLNKTQNQQTKTTEKLIDFIFSVESNEDIAINIDGLSMNETIEDSILAFQKEQPMQLPKIQECVLNLGDKVTLKQPISFTAELRGQNISLEAKNIQFDGIKPISVRINDQKHYNTDLSVGMINFDVHIKDEKCNDAGVLNFKVSNAAISAQDDIENIVQDLLKKIAYPDIVNERNLLSRTKVQEVSAQIIQTSSLLKGLPIGTQLDVQTLDIAQDGSKVQSSTGNWQLSPLGTYHLDNFSYEWSPATVEDTLTRPMPITQQLSRTESGYSSYDSSNNSEISDQTNLSDDFDSTHVNSLSSTQTSKLVKTGSGPYITVNNIRLSQSKPSIFSTSDAGERYMQTVIDRLQCDLTIKDDTGANFKLHLSLKDLMVENQSDILEKIHALGDYLVHEKIMSLLTDSTKEESTSLEYFGDIGLTAKQINIEVIEGGSYNGAEVLDGLQCVLRDTKLRHFVSSDQKNTGPNPQMHTRQVILGPYESTPASLRQMSMELDNDLNGKVQLQVALDYKALSAYIPDSVKVLKKQLKHVNIIDINLPVVNGRVELDNIKQALSLKSKDNTLMESIIARLVVSAMKSKKTKIKPEKINLDVLGKQVKLEKPAQYYVSQSKGKGAIDLKMLMKDVGIDLSYANDLMGLA